MHNLVEWPEFTLSLWHHQKWSKQEQRCEPNAQVEKEVMSAVNLSPNSFTTCSSSDFAKFICGSVIILFMVVLCRRTKANMESSCGKRTGEAYLTPLQQKEVAIRHLRSKLKETQCLLHISNLELKERVNRIQEDRAVEESQRAEAQLSVKHSKREIKRLRSVINTMKSILQDKDKGVPHYFIDINVQNKRLEALLETVDKMQESHKSEEQSISRRDGHSESESKTSETSGAETDTGEEDDEEEEDLQEKDEVETEIKGYLEKGNTAELEAEAAIVWDGSYGGDGSMMHERWATKEQVELRLFRQRIDCPWASLSAALVCQHAVPLGPRYWSRHVLLDTLAVAVPLLPTVAWFIAGRGGPGGRALGDGPQPFSSLPALLRGCSLLALRTLRSVPQSISSPLCNCTNPPVQQADPRLPPSGPSEC
uniref:Uncharacterized protein n=1 Tax=Eptatretus burgeri TaxID=7764 RepID=A0A8C4QGT2_EPTBU